MQHILQLGAPRQVIMIQHRAAPPPRAAPHPRAAPPRRETPQPSAAPHPREAPPRRAAPPPRAAPLPRAAPHPRAAPPRRETPQPSAAPHPREAPPRRAAPPPRAAPLPRAAPHPRAAPPRRETPQPSAVPHHRPAIQPRAGTSQSTSQARPSSQPRVATIGPVVRLHYVAPAGYQQLVDPSNNRNQYGTRASTRTAQQIDPNQGQDIVAIIQRDITRTMRDVQGGVTVSLISYNHILQHILYTTHYCSQRPNICILGITPEVLKRLQCFK